jgi:tetratricopeptide (TPR) repeat protein
MACVVAVIAAGWIGRTMLRNRDFRTAETLWRQNVRDCPGNPRGLRNLAELFTLQQRYDGAERVYREALAIPQLQTYAACGLGDALRRQGRFEEAREAYQFCISSDADASAAQFRALAGLAAAEVGLGFPDRAIALINEMSSPVWHGVRMAAADRWQAMGRGMVFKAAAHRRLGDAATADEELRRAVAFAVEKPSAAETIARACDDIRDFATAAILWEPIAARDPSVLANLAVSRIEAGQIDGAIEAFEQAVAAYPDEPGMRANLERAREIARRQADKTPASDSR